jgi:phosphate transport system substrate-binding protein
MIKGLMDAWAAAYKKDTEGMVKYASTGPARALSNVLDKVCDFGCIDACSNEEQLAKGKKPSETIRVPIALESLAVVYNLPGQKETLKLNGRVLADIYLGEITKWNHPSIARLNPGAKLPELEISVHHPSTPTGTTHIWTDYLTSCSTNWKSRVGAGQDVKWPVGEPAESDESLCTAVDEKAGAIGFIDLAHALKTKRTVAGIENSSGKFIAPTLESVSLAATGSLAEHPSKFSLANAPGEGAYPICGATWAVLYKDQTGEQGRELRRFLLWIVNDGQREAKAQGHAPLPEALVKKANARLSLIKTE